MSYKLVLQKVKPGKMNIYEIRARKFVESFSLIILDSEEREEVEQFFEFQFSHQSPVVTVNCETGSDLDKMFKRFAIKRKETIKNATQKYKSDIEGTSMLVRSPSRGTIMIARRDKGPCTINKLFIDNYTREVFFKSCKQSLMFIESKKYGIDLRDPERFETWSEYMDHNYLVNINE